MRTILLALLLSISTLNQAAADGFSITGSLGSSPIGAGLSTRAVLAYNASIAPNLSINAAARVNYEISGDVFSFTIRAAPKYAIPIIENSELSITAFAAIDLSMRIVQTPLVLFVTPLAGLDLSYAIDKQVTVYAGTEFDTTLNFDGKSLKPELFLSLYAEADYALTDAIVITAGTNAGSEFSAVYINPYLHLNYNLNNNFAFILEGGYDTGGFQANTNGMYVFLRARVKF